MTRGGWLLDSSRELLLYMTLGMLVVDAVTIYDTARRIVDELTRRDHDPIPTHPLMEVTDDGCPPSLVP